MNDFVGIAGLLALTVTLAVLDLLGSVVAAEWTRHGGLLRWLLGAAIFVIMFGVYGVTLHHARLTVVDSIWIAFGLLGVATLDLFVYSVRYPIDVMVALGGLLVLSVYVAWRMQ